MKRPHRKCSCASREGPSGGRANANAEARTVERRRRKDRTRYAGESFHRPPKRRSISGWPSQRFVFDAPLLGYCRLQTAPARKKMERLADDKPQWDASVLKGTMTATSLAAGDGVAKGAAAARSRVDARRRRPGAQV
ncbi:hypothetical protein MRX96_019222 [Rhipicephalus microplus]